MAFDMYLSGEREFIDHHEEELFYKINEDERFPKLNWLWEHFYNSPDIIPEISNYIVHELILLKSISDDKLISNIIEKLLPFFSKAYEARLIKKHKAIEKYPNFS